MTICIAFLLSLGDPGGAHLLPSETVSIRPAALRPGSWCGIDYVRTAPEDLLRGKLSATSFRGFVPKTKSALPSETVPIRPAAEPR